MCIAFVVLHYLEHHTMSVLQLCEVHLQTCGSKFDLLKESLCNTLVSHQHTNRSLLPSTVHLTCNMTNTIETMGRKSSIYLYKYSDYILSCNVFL